MTPAQFEAAVSDLDKKIPALSPKSSSFVGGGSVRASLKQRPAETISW
jgi:hypothetical protein